MKNPETELEPKLGKRKRASTPSPCVTPRSQPADQGSRAVTDPKPKRRKTLITRKKGLAFSELKARNTYEDHRYMTERTGKVFMEMVEQAQPRTHPLSPEELETVELTKVVETVFQSEEEAKLHKTVFASKAHEDLTPSEQAIRTHLLGLTSNKPFKIDAPLNANIVSLLTHFFRQRRDYLCAILKEVFSANISLFL